MEFKGGITLQEAERRAADFLGIELHQERKPEDEKTPLTTRFPEEKADPHDTD